MDLSAPEINLNKLPLTDGKVHFIRQVDNSGQINLLNETFNVGKEFISEYVWATICLRKQRLDIYYRAQDHDLALLIKEFGYDVNEEIKHLRYDIWNITRQMSPRCSDPFQIWIDIIIHQ